MALFDNGVKIGGSLAIGAGIALILPLMLPVVSAIVRPAAKGAIKGGIIAFEKIKLAGLEAIETIEDIAAEAKYELSQEEIEIHEES
jgi:hypothetical protein